MILAYRPLIPVRNQEGIGRKKNHALWHTQRHQIALKLVQAIFLSLRGQKGNLGQIRGQ